MTLLGQQNLRVAGERMSEAEIGLEDLYIKASQKKILNKYEDALKIYDQIISANEVNPAVHHDMARIYHEMENTESAVSSALKACRYDKSNHWYLLTLAQIYEETIQPGRAADALAQVIRLAPDESVYERRAFNLEQAGDETQAIRVYDQADAKYGWSEERSDSKVDLYIALGEEKNALGEVKKWSEKYPKNVKYIVKLARYLEYRGDAKKALKTYKKALEVDPYNEEALFKTSQVNDAKDTQGSALEALIANPRLGIDNKIKALLPYLSDKNNTNEVISYGQEIIDQYPEDAKAYALYGDMLWLSDETEDAITQYEKSLSLKKSVYQVWDQLMMGLAELKEVDKLLEVSNDAIDFYPNQAGPYYYQALALYSKGKVKDAIDMNDEALFISETGQGYISDHASILNASILDSQGSTQDAITYIEGLDDQALSAGLMELLGDLHIKTENKPAAENAWKRAIEKGGDKVRIGLKIQSI